MAVQREVTSVFDELLDFLLSSPTLQQVIDFQVSEAGAERTRYLLDANRDGTLTDAERLELDEFGRIGHVMRMLKIRALENLAQE
jgi:hypothetical protein